MTAREYRHRSAPVPRQGEVVRRALQLGAPELLEALGDRVGLLVDCLNALGAVVTDETALGAAIHHVRHPHFDLADREYAPDGRCGWCHDEAPRVLDALRAYYGRTQ